MISAPQRCEVKCLLNTGTRGPKSRWFARRILLPVSKDYGRHHGYSGSTLLPFPRRENFSFQLLIYAGALFVPLGLVAQRYREDAL
jgi:hypothetical protein